MAAQRNRVGTAFGEALKVVRIEHRMTQESLAERADFEASYISMLESGQRQPTITAIIAMEQALGLPSGDLVKRTVGMMKGKRLALEIHGQKRK